MARFIIEISDEQIRSLSDPDKVKERVSDDKSGMRTLVDMIASIGIVKRLDAGETEFTVSREMMKGDAGREEYFDKNVGDICMLAKFAMMGDGKSE